MEINKRTILWIVFAVSLVVLWNEWMVTNGKQSMFSPAPPPAQVATTPAAKPANSDVPSLPVGAQTVPGVPAQPAAEQASTKPSPSRPMSSKPTSTPWVA